MKEIYKRIIENTSTGNIKKQTSVEIIKLLKEYDEDRIDDIAVIGMSVKYPSAENADKLWWNIRNGVHTTTEFPERRKELIKDYLNFKGIKEDKFIKASYLEDISSFDYKFFNITPKEAELLDPNQRMFLENIYHTVEDSGYISTIKGSKTGVFLGFANELRETYINWLKECNPESLPMAVAGNLSSIIPARISFFKDLLGPAVLIDSACSSSLVAVHMACNSLRARDCDMALVGGVRINLLPLESNVKIGIESSDGKTKTFDDDSDGTGSGEGIASVLLKPLKAALRDKDNIYAVIKGSAVNQDGASAGITAPNLMSQKKVIIEAWKNAKINPETISYIEAHGTATKLGDPIEIEGINEAFKEFTDKKQFCAVGSVKSNLGHLFEGAGITGLIKSILCLKNKEIPGTVNFNYPNRRINFEESAVYVSNKLTAWESNGMPRRCGVSSFGFSGTNCHMVLEEYNPIEEKIETQDGDELFILSAKSKESLKEFLNKYIRFIERDNNTLSQICYSTNISKEQFAYRVGIIAKDKFDLYNKIKRIIISDFVVEDNNEIFYGYHNVASQNKKVLAQGDITYKDKRNLTSELTNLIKSDYMKIELVAKLYVKGGDTDWTSYYKGKNLKKISVPLYPFEKNSCWFVINKRQNDLKSKHMGNVIHPLVESLVVESINQDIYSTDFSIDKHFVLKDHVILDNSIIPGTTYIEMAHVIGKKYYGQAPLKIKDLTFVMPIHVEEKDIKTVQTIISKEKDCLSFKVVSKSNDNIWDTHAFGEIYRISDKKTQDFDIDDIEEKLRSEAIEINQNKLTEGFIKFGPRWINYKRLYRAKGVAIGELSLDKAFEQDLDEYYLHPSLLDMAVNIVSLTLGERYLPLSYENINVYGPTTMKFYSLVEVLEDELKGDTISFNLKLINEEGAVFLDVENYVLKKVREFNKIIKNNYFYSTVHLVQKLSESGYLSLNNKNILLLHDESDLSNSIKVGLREKDVNLFDAAFSNEYAKKNEDKYCLDLSEESYIKLFKDIRSKRIDYIINVFNDESQYDLVCKLHSLFCLSKALSKESLNSELKIIILTKNMDNLPEGVIDHNSSTIHGMSKVISKEQNIFIKCINIDNETIISDVINEIESEDKEYLVAYRKGKRLIEVIEKLNIEEISSSNLEIKKSGAYLITGGTGGIGLEISKYLTDKIPVQLALINRSEFPKREYWDEIINQGKKESQIKSINIIREIEKKGTTVEFYSCDVSNKEQLSAVLNDVREKFTKINGIFHCAGNAGNGFIINKSFEEFSSVVGPKIMGTELLHSLTVNDNIDFLVLFSSVASVLSLPGQSDYTAANGFMDGFTYYRNELGLRTLSINWPAWSETGMAVNNNADIDTLFKTIGNSVAIENLNELLSREVSRAIVGQWHYDSMIYQLADLNYSNEIYYILQKQKEREENKSTDNTDSTVILKGNDSNKYSDVEITVGKIWGETLGYKELNIYDNFYDLGGDSIIAVRLINNINKELKTNINVTSVFNYLTIYDFAKYINENIYKNNDEIEAKEILNKVDKRDYYPVTAEQKGIYLACKYDNVSRLYNLPLIMEMAGEYSLDKLKGTFIELINRHEGLRTTFGMVGEELVQRENTGFDFEIDILNCDEAQLDQMVFQLIKPFDLDSDLLIRASIIKSSNNRSFLFIDTHHIVADGYSMAILLNNFISLYEGFELPELSFNYFDYSEWQRNRVIKNELESQKTYWLNKYKELPEVLNLTTDYQRGSIREFEGDYIKFAFDRNLGEKIKQLSNNYKSTNFTTLITAFNILLHKYTGQDDIVVGSSISGRLNSDLQNIVGMFMNMLPLRTHISNKAFIEILEEKKLEILDAIKNQEYNFNDIINNLNLQRDTSRNPLFDFCFNLQNINKDIEITDVASPEFGFKLKDLELKSYDLRKKISKYDFMFEIIENQTGFKGYIEYNTKLFKKETMEQMANNFLYLLSQIAENPEIKTNDLEIVNKEEINKIVYGFNDNKKDFDEDKLLHMILEENAEKHPEKIAVSYENKEITYRSLNQGANRRAKYFKEKSIEKEDLIAILLPRCPDMMEIILGGWKIGAAYIPMDLKYPLERIATIMKDSDAKYLMTYSEFVTEELEEALGDKIIKLDEVEEEISGMDSSNLSLKVEKGTLAYVIYTSGSTGKPKGAMVEQVGMMNHILCKIEDVKLDEDSIIVQNASQCFDISVWQFFAAIVCGGKTVIYPNEVAMNPKGIISRVIEDKVTVLEVVPSFLAVVIDYIKENNVKFTELNYVLVTGETLKSGLVTKWFEVCSDVKLINAYGPTEASDDITHYIISEDLGLESIPIGKPIQNMSIYIIDKNEKLCPIGVKGEIAVSGVGVGRGYLNNPEKTQAAFTVDKYRKEKGVRLYKTGDLGRWLPDGTIEFFGRKDYQVKIRGFRIELGEIESRLMHISNVKECVVIDLEDESGTKYLAAYIVSEKEIDALKIKEELKISLPDYMIPAFFVQLESMPLSSNGKIDRKALPKPEGSLEDRNLYVAPGNEVEENMVRAWEEILGVGKIGIKDNFFELGGDSIKAIRIVSKAQKYGYTIELKDIFVYSTVEELVGRIKFNEENTINQEPVVGDIDLIPVQEWFFQKDFTQKHHWNQAIMLYKEDKINRETVEKAFQKIIEHHDALRIVFNKKEGRYHQYNRAVDDGVFYDLKEYEVKDAANSKEYIIEQCNILQGEMDLEKGPLIKIAIFREEKGEHLFIAIHHLLIDGVSWRILLEDLLQIYSSLEKEEEAVLPLKTNSYKEWSEYLMEYSSSKEIEEDREYWDNLQARDIKPLPLKDTSGNGTVSQNKDIAVEFTEEETRDFLRNVNKAYNTEANDILLSALALTINKWTEYKDILINLEGHGREAVYKDINVTRTIGWFTTEYPVILEVDDKEDVSLLIKATKENIRHIPGEGASYGVLKYLSENGLKNNLNPQICFNYLGQFDEELENSIFKRSKIGTGNSISLKAENSFVLDINGVVENQKLKIIFTYNEKDLDEEVVKDIAKNYNDNLVKIIEHCKGKRFIEKTPSDYKDYNLSLEELGEINKKYSNDFEVEKIYGLTSLQQGMIFEYLMDKDGFSNINQFAFTLVGDLDEGVLEKSFQGLVDKHDALRTVFVYNRLREQKQIVLKGKTARINYKDYSMLEDIQSSIEQMMLNEINEPFKLEKDILVKLSVFKVKDNTHYLIWSYHHIVLDGWSIPIITRDLFDLYISNMKNETVSTKSFGEFGEFIRYVKNKNKEEAKDYWTAYLSDYDGETNLPEKSLVDRESYIVRESVMDIDNMISEKLAEITQKEKITLNNLIESVWGVVLQRYNNLDDVIFGKVVSGRNVPIEGVENIAGLFINTIPVRVKSNGNTAIIDLAKEIKNNSIEAEKYDYYSLAEIQRATAHKRDLINNILVFQNYYIDDVRKNIKEETGIDINFNKTREQTKYNLNVEVEFNEEIRIRLRYNEGLYDHETIKIVGQSIYNVLIQIAENPEIKINDLEIVNKEEINKIVYGFNDNKKDFDEDKLLHMILEEKAEKHPEKIAVSYENKEITYRSLNEGANRRARYFKEKSIEKEDLIAILLPRCPDMMEIILGGWKIGAAYIPMDLKYPLERMATIMKDSDAKYLMTYSEFVTEELEEALGDKIIKLDEVEEEISGMDSSNLSLKVEKGTLAYVIYTSGSTGKPKGAMVEQVGMMNHILCKIEDVKLDEDSIIVQNASQCFDISVWQFFAAIVCGGKTVIYPNEVAMNPKGIISRVIEDKVTVLEVVPSFLAVVIDYIKENNVKFTELNYVLVTGETLKSGLVTKWFEVCSDVKLINAYGPTEASDDITHYIISEDLGLESIPIGKPIQNMSIYIIDKNEKLCPIGVKGEIAVSGVGVGRGYLNNPEKTQAAFTVDKYRKEKGVRLYKTGDLGRWLPDGTIEFFGRKDYQVKIRGFRIELGEIESRLMHISNVKECVVIDLEDESGTKYLAAYIVSEKEIDALKIKEELKISLPDYMIPAFFVQLESMPLSSNGKIDRKALPKPEGSLEDRNLYVAPGNEVEENMVRAWEEILGVGKIGIKDNFFELGGDSIKAIRIVSKAQKYGYTIELKDIFVYSTVEELVGRIKFNEENTINQEPVVGDIDLIPVQEWFFQKDFTQKHHWNQAIMLYKEDKINRETVEKAFQKIIEHHDALRIVFNKKEGRYHQYNRAVDDGVFYDLKEYEVKDAANSKEYIIEQCNILQGEMDLEKGPLIKIAIFREEKGEHLFIAIHHLLIDGVSWRILLEDLLQIYSSLEKEEEAVLPLKTNSYKEWSEYLMEYSSSKEIEEDREYWDNLQARDIKPLPLKDTSGNGTVSQNKDIAVEFTEEETRDFLRNVNKAYNTEANDILLSALALTINKWTEYKDILINLEGHGREAVYKDININRTVGWFTTEYPVVLEVRDKEDISSIIKDTKENLRHIPNKGLSYGILKYIGENKLEDKITPQICFNYLGQFDEEFTGGIFEISKLSTGNNVSLKSENLFALDIEGGIERQSLKIVFTYNENYLDGHVVETLADNYKHNLISIIDHCKAKKVTENTASDFESNLKIFNDRLIIKPLSENEKNAFNGNYPLSRAEKRLLIVNEINQKDLTYNTPFVLDVDGELDITKLEHSFKKIIEKNEIMRTNFVFTDGVPVQRVHEEIDFKINIIESNTDDEKEVIKSLISSYDLKQLPLFRVFLINMKNGKQMIMIDIHHIISDGVSIEIMVEELVKIYNGMPTKDLEIQYKDFSVWQEKYLSSDSIKDMENYWINKLENFTYVEFPNKNSGEYNSIEGARVEFYFDKEEKSKIKKYSVQQSITKFSFFASILNVILKKELNVEDITIGVPVTGRNSEQLQDIIGMFTNVILLRTFVDGEMNFKEYIKSANNSLMDALANQDYPYEELHEKISEKYKLNKQALYSIMINFLPYESDELDEIRLGNAILKYSESQIYIPKSDMVFYIYENKDSFRVEIIYNKQQFNDEIIERLTKYYKEITNSVINNHEILIKDIEYKIQSENAELIEDFDFDNDDFFND
jgi:iturin family lipopeptide synthetase B